LRKEIAMNRIIYRLKIIFVCVFAVACVVVWTAHIFWIWPGQRCEARSMWWDWRTRTCALPVPLHVFTGRNPLESEIKPAPMPVAPQP
jgi:hypothetical protein